MHEKFLGWFLQFELFGLIQNLKLHLNPSIAKKPKLLSSVQVSNWSNTVLAFDWPACDCYMVIYID